MFSNTITIFNIVKKDNIEYRKKVVNNVFYYNQKIISSEGKGDKYNSSHNVIFSNTALKDYLQYEDYQNATDYENYYTLRVNDIIVLGECDNITDLSDLQKSNKEFFLIKTIADNRYGSEELQNIEVTD
jgi:hypothetical protein